tara:strand:- start:1165 stop:1320 length:156 start_codon:yes stop_codon:yes gene_type:complete
MAAGTKCKSCNRTLTCGCQKRKASDGTQVCSSCAAAYEAKLKQGRLNKFVK